MEVPTVPMAMVLEESVDDGHEPDQNDCLAYATWLGIDMTKDLDLLWIARAGLTAPLPTPWKPCQAGDDGELFYFNFETGESVWDHPCDEFHRQLFAREYAKKYGLPLPVEPKFIPGVSENADAHCAAATAYANGTRGSAASLGRGSSDLGVTGGGDDSGGDDPLEASGSSVLGTSGEGENGKKGKRDKKDKKGKKEKKDRSRFGAPKELAPIGVGSLGGKLMGLGAQNTPRGNESEDGGLPETDEDGLAMGSAGSGLGAFSEGLAPIIEDTHEHLQGSQGSFFSGGDKAPMEPMEPDLASEMSAQSPGDRLASEMTRMLGGNGEVPQLSSAVDYREKLQSEEASRIEREVAEWAAREKLFLQGTQRERIEREVADRLDADREKLEAEFSDKFDALSSDHRAKIAKHRKDITEQFNVEKDKVFNELQTNHDKDIRDERQRLSEEMRSKQAEIRSEAEGAAASEAELRKKLSELEDEETRLRARLSEAEAARDTSRQQAHDLQQKLNMAAANDNALAELEELRSKVSAQAAEISRVRAEKIEEIEAIMAEQSVEVDKVKTEKANELKQVKAEAQTTADRLKQLEQELNSLKSSTGEGDATQEQLATSTQELEMTQAMLTAKTNEWLNLSQDLAQSNDSHSAEVRGLNDQLAERELKIADLSSQVGGRASIDSDVDQAMASYRSEREASERQGLDRELSEWVDAERAKLDQDRSKKIQELQDEMQAELAQRRKQLAEELEREREKAFGDLRAAHEQELGGERQRLQQEARAKLGQFESDVNSMVGLEAELQRRLGQAEADLAASRAELDGAQRQLEERLSEATTLKLDKGELEHAREVALAELGRVKAESSGREDRLREGAAKERAAKADLDTRLDELERSKSLLVRREADCESLTEQLAKGDAHNMSALQNFREQLRERDETAAGQSSEVRRMKFQLEEEKSKVLRLQADSSSVGSKASLELAALNAELEARSTECGRLRAELAVARPAEDADQKEAEMRELVSLRAQLLEQRTEVERLREQSGRASQVSPEEQRSLQRLVKERDETIVTLRADMAKVVAAHSDEMQELSTKLVDVKSGLEDARRRAGTEVAATTELQTKLQARQSEIDKLQSEVRANNLEAERLRGEARYAGSQASAAEAERLSTVEQWKRDMQRLESMLQERSNEVTSSREQADRSARDLRRFELDEQRGAKRLESLQTDLDRAREQMQQLREEAIEAERKLKIQVEDERAASHRAQAELSGVVSKASSEQVAIAAELDARSAECGRLRAELTTRPADAGALRDVETRELVALRSQAVEQRAEINRMRAQFSSTSVASPEEEKALRSVIKERDDAILQLKSELSQVKATHERASEDLGTQLKDALSNSDGFRRRHENDAGSVVDMQAKLKAKAAEIEDLSCQVRAQAAEIERVTVDHRNSELRMASRESSAVESAKASVVEQWRRELQKVEDQLHERTQDAIAGRELADRTGRELRRLELEESRMSRRVESLQSEIDHSKLQTQQVRDEALDSERHLEDVRVALRGEHGARARAECQVKECQHEIRALRDQIQQQQGDLEVAGGEVRRCRNDIVEREMELSRLQDQVRVRESDLRQMHTQREVLTQQAEHALRWRVGTVADRERSIIDREAVFYDWGHTGFEYAPRLELTGFRTAAELLELQGPKAVELTLPGALPGVSADLSGSAGDARTGSKHIVTETDDLAPQGDVASNEGLDEVRDLGGFDVGSPGPSVGIGAAGVTVTSPSRDDQGAGETAMLLDARRRDLRRERSALEELRRQWKSDAQRMRALGLGGQAQLVLQDVRGHLDERTSSLNRSIDEFRSVEQALVAQRQVGSGSGARKSSRSPQRHWLSGEVETLDHLNSSSSPTAFPKPSRSDTGATTPRASSSTWAAHHHPEEADLLKRWRSVLGGSPNGERPSLSAGGTSPSWGQSARRADSRGGGSRTARDSARDNIDTNLSWLRGFSSVDSVLGGFYPAARPFSSRGTRGLGFT